MSARYSLMVILIVAVLLMLNSLWVSRQGSQACVGADCDNTVSAEKKIIE